MRRRALPGQRRAEPCRLLPLPHVPARDRRAGGAVADRGAAKALLGRRASPPSTAPRPRPSVCSARPAAPSSRSAIWPTRCLGRDGREPRRARRRAPEPPYLDREPDRLVRARGRPAALPGARPGGELRRDPGLLARLEEPAWSSRSTAAACAAHVRYRIKCSAAQRRLLPLPDVPARGRRAAGRPADRGERRLRLDPGRASGPPFLARGRTPVLPGMRQPARAPRRAGLPRRDDREPR